MQAERWEHRVWFDGPAEPLERLAREGEEVGAEYRTDTYLLGPDAALLPKLRDNARFEVKRLLETKDGLERWRAETSLPFPVSGANVYRVLPGVPSESLRSPEALLAYAATLEGMRVVAVRKHRRRYALDEGEAEITMTQGGSLPAATLGIEAPDHDGAMALVRRLGTDPFPNRSYGTALRG